jgi:pepSY-associated TM helix domain protein
MNGAEVHGLPALRIDYGDAENTRVYIDLRTGQMADSMNAAQRNRRWLFYFLHSWDVPAILRTGSGRDAVLILLSAGGLAVSVTGVVIGWRRVKVKVARG